MKRIQIEIPQKILWKSSRKIQQSDINIAAHMGNDRILVWADEIRNDFFVSIGWEKHEWFKNVGIIVANHSIAYKSEGFLGEQIDIELSIDNVSECTFDMYIKLKKADSNKDMILLRTGLVCFDYSTRKISELPKEFMSILS